MGDFLLLAVDSWGSLADFLNRFLFHWVPSKAVWIGGHSLSWDARCAGIYAGFGGGVLYQAAARWKAWEMPSLRLLALHALLTLPLFLDVLAITLGLRTPSNDVRYLSGLLFGGALSAALFPAFIVLVLGPTGGRRGRGAWRHLAPYPAVSGAAFFLKEWDSAVAYGILEGLSILGFLSLLGILSLGTFKALGNAARLGNARKRVLLIALIPLISACAARAPSLRPDSCDPEAFVPSPQVSRDCKRETCRDGKIVWVEDLTQMAPVDDWAEERFCLRHPVACIQAYGLKKKTEKWQKSLEGKYWTKKRNALGDAARHAHLMCVLAARFGPDFARGLGAAHEEESEFLLFFKKAAPGNPCCEKVMDLYNNEIGIQLAGKPGTCEEKVLSSLHLLQHSLCPGDIKDGEY